MAVHSNVLEKFESKKYICFDHFAQNKRYAALFTQLVGLLVATPEQNLSSIISISGREILDEKLNQIKLRALQCINMLFKYVFDEVPTTQKDQSPFLEQGGKLYPFIVSTLRHIT